jgi:hypothetical protein
MARRRAGVPITYITRPIGKRPYRTKVISAPSKLPVVLVASASAIIKATYSQAMGTMYMVN